MIWHVQKSQRLWPFSWKPFDWPLLYGCNVEWINNGCMSVYCVIFISDAEYTAGSPSCTIDSASWIDNSSAIAVFFLRRLLSCRRLKAMRVPWVSIVWGGWLVKSCSIWSQISVEMHLQVCLCRKSQPLIHGCYQLHWRTVLFAMAPMLVVTRNHCCVDMFVIVN